jgi:hypothetical protein
VSCDVNLGEFKERYRVMNHSKPTLSEAEARSAVQTAAPRNVQRLGLRALRPMMANSAQPCDAIAGEEIVHGSTRDLARARKRNEPGPAGGGLWGTLACQTDLIHFQNGEASHTGILRLARAVLLPPRQNLRVEAKIFQLPDAGSAVTFGNVQGGNRNMLSLKDNLNAVDAINKIITFTFDGCCSAATCSSHCTAATELAVEKPTSNEEPPATCRGNPVVNRSDELREPRETSADGDRVTASRKQGRDGAGVLRLVNGGHAAKGAVGALPLAA